MSLFNLQINLKAPSRCGDGSTFKIPPYRGILMVASEGRKQLEGRCL